MRRLKAARLAAKYQEVIQLLKERKINLTNISLIEPVITAENYNKLFKAVVGKSKREVEEILVEYKAPVSKAREKITPIAVKPVSNAPSVENQFEITNIGEPANSERSYQVSFAVTEDTMQKLKKAQAQSKHGHRLADLFDCLLDEYLKKRTPKRNARGSSNNSRYISKSDKELVLNRDGYQCSYIGPDGNRCSCTKGLQFDHIKPFCARGVN